jgi:hypothetical protein
MTDRADLIARKEGVRREMERIRRDLAREEARPSPSAPRIQQLREQIERLTAEEFSLRIAIDRSPIK